MIKVFCLCDENIFFLIKWRRAEGLKRKESKREGEKGNMAPYITTSQVINEHCSCCHGNYYHSDVANGIWDRAREICENYCQIQLGSFRLSSAGPPSGPSLISYQIERRIEMLELRHPNVRVITASWRSLREEGWPYPATLITIIADIFLLVVVQIIIGTGNIIVLTMPETPCVSEHFSTLFGTETKSVYCQETTCSSWFTKRSYNCT